MVTRGWIQLPNEFLRTSGLHKLGRWHSYSFCGKSYHVKEQGKGARAADVPCYLLAAHAATGVNRGKGSQLRRASGVTAHHASQSLHRIKSLSWMMPKKKNPMPTATAQTYIQHQVCPRRAGGTKQYLQERVFCASPPFLGGKEGSNKSTVSLINCIYFLYPWDSICFQVTFRAWPSPPLPHSQPGPLRGLGLGHKEGDI